MLASEHTVRDFLATTELSGYQRVPLPYDLAVPGRDRRAMADVVFSRDVVGKRVLDVGTYYGYFAVEAMRRGASAVVAVESDPARAAVARRIAELYGNAYTILETRAEDLHVGDAFDLVLLLNVVHHLTDPIAVLRTLASISTELVVVGFPTLTERKFLARSFMEAHPIVRAIETRLMQALLGRLSRTIPLAFVGDRRYHNGFLFSERAFHNLVLEHLQIFRGVEFVRSPERDSRVLAFCHI